MSDITGVPGSPVISLNEIMSSGYVTETYRFDGYFIGDSLTLRQTLDVWTNIFHLSPPLYASIDVKRSCLCRNAIPPSSQPLENEARTISGVWTADDSLKFGVRIDGVEVPLPGAFWLLGSGLLGLAGWRRFMK
jgi:hypothetical protein